MKKKLLTIFLGLIVAMTMLPIQSVFASEGKTDIGTAVTKTVESNDSNKTKSTVKATTSSSPVSVRVYGTYNYSYAYSVLSKVNSERKKRGKAPLKMDKDLLADAMKRAVETAVYWDHIRPSGYDCFSIDKKVYGENIAVGQTTPTRVMNSWMNSAGHKANILRSGYKTIGIGVVKVGSYYYWVQNFGYSDYAKAGTVSSKVSKTTTVYAARSSSVLKPKCTLNSTAISKGKTTTAKMYQFNGFAYTKVSSSSVKYSSSNSVCKVSTLGTVQGVKKGTSYITVAFKDMTSIKSRKLIRVK